MTKQAKTFTGIVSSNKTDKTIVVKVVTRKTHPLYKKQYTSSKKFMAHDENNEAGEGDRVTITETKPMSARKRFVLGKIIERAPVRHVEAVDEAIVEAAGQKTKEDKPKPEAEKPAKQEKKE